MLPVFDHPDAVATFMSFLQNQNELVEGKIYRFEQDQWQIDEDFKLNWPKTGILCP
jgi:hypothetical protein